MLMEPHFQIIAVAGRKIMMLLSMHKLEELLPKNFYRIHRSHMVNNDRIDSINSNKIRLKDHIPILSKKKMHLLNEYIYE